MHSLSEAFDPTKKDRGQSHFKKLMAWIFNWFILKIFGPKKGGRGWETKNSREKLCGSALYICVGTCQNPGIESPNSCEFDEDDEIVPLISIYMKSRSG